MTVKNTASVTVVIPTYNHAKYLLSAIDSVLQQTVVAQEIVVVDDGSTDDTAQAIAKLDAPNLKYIFQANQGLAAARNTGISSASGEFLAFLDADDEWESRFIERCLSELDHAKELAVVYTGVTHIDPNGNRLPQASAAIAPEEQVYERLLEGGFFPPCAAIAQARVVRDVGMFDTELIGRGAEDWDLWLRISQRYLMRGVPEALAKYRVHPGSMSTNIVSMNACRMSVLAKLFGPPAGNPYTWPEQKRRAYAFSSRRAALDYVAQGQADDGWFCLKRAVEIYPGILARLDTFYELVLGDQARGYRGQAELVDVRHNGVEMLCRMDTLFAAASPPVQALRDVGYGNAYLALAMLSDQAGDWPAARRYMRRAIQANPALLRDSSVTRRMFKLSLGQRLTDSLRKLRPAGSIEASQ